MKISLLNEKITFEKNTVTVDENANHKNEWSEYFTCHAYADTSGAKGEKESAGITVTESGLVFTLRFCSELSELDATHYRVRFHDEPYNITSIDMMNYSRRTLKVTCEKERRDS